MTKKQSNRHDMILRAEELNNKANAERAFAKRLRETQGLQITLEAKEWRMVLNEAQLPLFIAELATEHETLAHAYEAQLIEIKEELAKANDKNKVA